MSSLTHLAGPVGRPSVGIASGGVVDVCEQVLPSVVCSTPGAKWTPLYWGGGGIARQQFLGKVLHCRRLFSSTEFTFFADSLTANDRGRCIVDDVEKAERLVVREGGLGSVAELASVVVVVVVVVVIKSSANGVGGDNCCAAVNSTTFETTLETIVSLKRSKLMLRRGWYRTSTVLLRVDAFVSSVIRKSSPFDGVGFVVILKSSPFEVVGFVVTDETSLISSLTSS
jgi:phosphohistidine swiveling domain-containing protein